MNFKAILYGLLMCILVWSCTKEDSPQIGPKTTESFARTAHPQLEPELQELLELNEIEVSEIPHLGTRVVMVPGGSENALQKAIQTANGGLVFLRKGEHRVSMTVTIRKRVIIIGEKGAVLISNTQPSALATAIPAQPALHIINAPDTHVGGLDIRPQGEAGNTGILVENSPRAKIVGNTITAHQFSIVLEKSNNAFVYSNTVVGTTLWQSGQLPYVYGIINVNGEGVRIFNNDISSSLVGLWACSDKGLASGNKLHGDFIGVLLCKVPDNFFSLPEGNLTGSIHPGNNWLLTDNNAYDNLDVGYLVIDGAHKNLLRDNTASNNTRVDYEVAGDSNRFGFFTPKGYENTLYVKDGNTVKDCGDNNTIVGGVRIDTNVTPCF